MLFSMEPYQPATLNDYCRYFNLSFFDVSLQCVFCKFVLDTQHLAAFHKKCLRLVWRNGNCYACCCQCCRVSARYEFERHKRCSISAAMIQDVLRKPLNEIQIRCYGCLGLLDLVEKVDTISREDSFYLVRDGWKGLCRQCTPK